MTHTNTAPPVSVIGQYLLMTAVSRAWLGDHATASPINYSHPAEDRRCKEDYLASHLHQLLSCAGEG